MKSFNTINKTSLLAACIAAALFSINIEQAVSAPKRANPQSEPKRVSPQAAQRVNPQQAPSAQQPALKLGVPFSATCASGFTKAGQQAMGNGDMNWYVCSTPVITCPSYTQSNGLKANVTPKAIVQMIGGNPDSGGPQKFRVQYKCDYSFNNIPAG